MSGPLLGLRAGDGSGAKRDGLATTTLANVGVEGSELASGTPLRSAGRHLI